MIDKNTGNRMILQFIGLEKVAFEKIISYFQD